MHGVQVVDESLHGLIGGPVGLLLRKVDGLTLAPAHLVLAAILFNQPGQLRLEIFLIVLQPGLQPGLLGDGAPQGLQILLDIPGVVPDHQALGQIAAVVAGKGLAYAVGHAVVEVDNGLAAVLIVLIGLDGNTGQSGVGGDVVGLPQMAVAGGKATLEQLFNIDLAAGGGEGIEVQVVDVDVPLPVGLGLLGLQDKHLIELLGPLAAVFQHGAHGGVGVDVGIFPLDVAVH